MGLNLFLALASCACVEALATPALRAGSAITVAPRARCNMKETTLDRLTGPKLFKTVTNWEGIHSVPLVPLRVLTGVLMIHHGSEGGFWPANYGTPG